MSPIDGLPGFLGALVGSEPALEIAENIGASTEASIPTTLVDQELLALALTELPAAAETDASDPPGLSLLGLRPPPERMADVDPGTIQSLLHPAANDGAAKSGFGTALLQRLLAMTQDSVGSKTQESAGASSKGQPSDASARSTLDTTRNALSALEQLAANPALQVERGGVIASFILNTGMLPQLPVQPPPIGVEQALNPAALLPNPALDDEEALTYLANLGADQTLLEKLRKMLKKKVPGKKLLLGLAALMTAVTVVTEMVGRELESLSEDWRDNEENRNRADSRGHSGRRRHLYLE